MSKPSFLHRGVTSFEASTDVYLCLFILVFSFMLIR